MIGRVFTLLALFIAGNASRSLLAEPVGHSTTSPVKALTVAVLDFQANTPGSPELGQQIAETLTVALSGQPGYSLVDRSSLLRTVEEQHLNLTGAVSSEQAIKVGQIVGAKILITGKVFSLDKQLFISAKMIGTETTLVEGVVVKGDVEAGVSDLMMKAANELSRALPEKGPRLIASDAAAFDPVPALKQQLSTRKLPKVAVKISERHIAGQAASARIDPAVETEVRQLLIDSGFTVIDGDEKDWAKAGVEVVISGEGFSEVAARIGNLVSCTARAEIKVVRNSDNAVLLADRDSNRAVDLAENLAGKTALQKAGHVLGLKVLAYFAGHLPAK